MNTYRAIKNQHFKFVSCNDAFAEKAGLDSPQQIVGKTDHDLTWHKDAEDYISSDRIILSGKSYLNKIESQITEKILVSKSLLKRTTKKNYVVLSFIDTKKLFFVEQDAIAAKKQLRLYLGDEEIRLTKQQSRVLKFTVMGLDTQQIADKMAISHRTVETHTNLLKAKFRVTRKNGLIEKVWTYDLIYLIDLVS